MIENRYESINCKSAEICAANARKVGRRKTSSGVGGTHGQFVSIQRLDDFRRQQRL
jgi:hypothetical protein